MKVEPKYIIVSVFKLLLCGVLFFIGMIVGGMVAQALGIQPVVPEGMEPGAAMLALLLTSPMLALGVALPARGIGGGRWMRALVLAWFTWVVYGLNTALETLIIMPAQSFWFNSLSSLVASALLATAVALLFRAPDSSVKWKDAWQLLWSTRKGGEWLLRLALAAVVFMPIYYFFGLLAIQVTGPYYQQNFAGLTAPTLEQLLPILFVRSVLFMLACLPIVVLWQKSERALIVSLGAALFMLVGLVPLLAGYWLPLIVRVTHSLEILADEFVYAWVLVKLLQKGAVSESPDDRSTQFKSGTHTAR